MSLMTEEGYLKIPISVIEAGYTPYELALYVVLLRDEFRFHDGAKRTFYRTDEKLAEDSNMSVSSVRRARDRLEKDGRINVGKQGKEYGDGRRSRESVTTYRLTE